MNSDASPRRIPRTDQYPCPWCSEHSGFAVVDPNTPEGWFKNTGISAARMLLNPVKAIRGFGNPLAETGDCLNCHRRVTICPYCDHPNRPIGLFYSCINCKKDFTGFPS